jgi:hypothetical protein
MNCRRRFEALYRKMGCGREGKDFIVRAKWLMEENKGKKIFADLFPVTGRDRIPGFKDLEKECRIRNM